MAPAGQAVAASAGPVGLHTRHAYLLDAGPAGTARRRLWGIGAATPLPMASTTKIMTAVVVLETPRLDLNRRLTVRQAYLAYASRVGASTAGLRAGDRLTVRQLLYGLLLPSGSDAAYALADGLGKGSDRAARVGSFIGRMNAEARRLGMTGTHYDSFDGISRGGNRSTAADLARLGETALRLPEFARIVATRRSTQRGAYGHRYTWTNTDRLLTAFPGALGVKTGNGPADGYCLVFAARRHGRTLVGALLADDSRHWFRDAAAILAWGFRQPR
ncbi:D-alanyl-D-alanine carboxypeptidase family protein [Phaeacidiphilus oryzae]|uniref:D-alanyl-D-alanine carboxypeptidase family protein n=1 Tax=Phaeacidiphilus oryzae TaxID=348818 RepID=UPI00068DD238|nr:serine hydrolase [Phaeacidiphilus oryzae]